MNLENYFISSDAFETILRRQNIFTILARYFSILASSSNKNNLTLNSMLFWSYISILCKCVEPFLCSQKYEHNLSISELPEVSQSIGLSADPSLEFKI